MRVLFVGIPLYLLACGFMFGMIYTSAAVMGRPALAEAATGTAVIMGFTLLCSVVTHPWEVLTR